MITNKDIRVENGFLIINGDKYPLDGQSPEAIMQIVEDNSDTTPTENSDAPITSGGIFTALGTKQDTLTFDTVPTDESTNPVTSGGIFTAIGNKVKKLAKLSYNYTFQTANTYEYTNVSVTVPAGHTYMVRARLTYSNSDPKGIAASERSDAVQMYRCYAKNELAAYITFMLCENETAYIWAKGATAIATDAVEIEIVDILN